MKFSKLLINSWCLLISLIFFLPNGYSETNSSSSNVKIQVSGLKILPWHYEASGSSAALYRQAVHSRALYITPNFEIKPGYIKKWKWDYDQKKFTFILDSTLTYSDGRPISAFDLEFVLLKPFLGTVGVSDQTPLMFIRGIEKLKKGEKFRSGMAEGVKVIDNTTIDVYLTGNNQRFLYSLASFVISPLAPIEEFKEDLYSFKSTPIGSGNYIVSKFDNKTGYVMLKRNRGSKGPETVELYSSGGGWENNVDIALGGGVANMGKHLDKGYRKLQGSLPYAVELIDFNYSTKAGALYEFRKAVALSINKEWQLRNYPGEKPTDQIITSLSYGSKKAKAYFDPIEAKRLVANLPIKMRKATHSIMYHGLDANPLPDYMKDILKDLSDIGLKVKAIASSKMKLTPSDSDITMIVHGRVVDSDPLMSFAYYLPEGGFPLQAPSNDLEFRRLFQQAENAESLQDKAKSIEALTNHHIKNFIQIPLSERFPIYFIKNRVKNLGIENNAFDLTIENIEIDNVAE